MKVTIRGCLTQAKLIMLLNDSQPGKKTSRKVNFSERELGKYFPPNYTASEMKNLLIRLLTEWNEKNGGENSDEL